MIEVSGKASKAKTHLCIEAAEFAVRKLMPRLRNKLDVKIVFKKMDIYGECDWIGDKSYKPREFLIKINPNYSLKEVAMTMIHEMIHVKHTL